MRFDQNGMSLWYGTSDAPAPDATMPAGAGGRLTRVTVTVGVRPRSARNRVDVYYRVNGGTATKALKSQDRADARANSQFYVARLSGSFKVGDTVEYGAVCVCGGRQIPSPGPPNVFQASFRVVAAGAHAAAGALAAATSSSTPASKPASDAQPARDPKSGRSDRPVANGPAEDSDSKSAGTSSPDGRSTGARSEDGTRPNATDPKDAAPGRRANRPSKATPDPDEKEVHEVLALAGLRGAAADQIAKVAPTTSALDDEAIAQLVKKKIITDAQGTSLGFAVALYEVADRDLTLAEAIRSASLPTLGGKRAESIADLARLTPADWATFLGSTHVAPPAGGTPGGVGAALARRLAEIEPNVALFARLPQVSATDVAAKLNSLAALLPHNPDVVGAPFTDLTLTGLTNPQTVTAVTDHTALQELANAYPGLDFAGVLDDPKIRPAAKANAVARLAGLVQQVGTRLGATPVLRLDLSQGSEDISKLDLDKIGATEREQAGVLSTLKAHQRVWAVAKDIDATHALVRAGFTSAHGMAKLPLRTFRARSGLGSAADPVWERARASMSDVALATAAILDSTHPRSVRLATHNQPASVGQYLAQLPGYQQLFGSLSFCDCQECQSIIGPAAYFVDLMKYIQDSLLDQFAGRPNDPLDLKVRRPDLWTLVLSCDNTNTRVPTLDIVNQVLENYIARSQASLTLEDLTDRPRIDAIVYEKTLMRGVHSFRQPFWLPLARIASYLPALGSSLSAVAAAVGASATENAQAELLLSSAELAIVTTPKSDLATLSDIYGMTFERAHDGAGVEWMPPASSGDRSGPPDAAVLGPAMGLSRADLGNTVSARFVRAGGADVRIEGGRRNAQSIQNDVEWVHGLNADALDRMHRFTRMVRRTGWSIADVDMLLTALDDTTLALPVVESVAELHALKRRFQLATEDLSALVGLMPGSLFDQRFNTPFYVAESGKLPQPAVRFLHPSFLQGVDASRPDHPPEKGTTRPTIAQVIAQTLPRLLTGLRVNLGDLEVLIRGLAGRLAQESRMGFNPDDADPYERYFVLSLANLTLLYRCALLSRFLGVPVDGIFQLLGFLGIDLGWQPRVASAGGVSDAPSADVHPAEPHETEVREAGIPEPLAALAALTDLVNLWDWWKSSGYSLDDVAVAIGQTPRNPAPYLDPGTVAQQVVANAARALTFSASVFSVALGVTEQASTDLLTSLSAAGGSVPALIQASPFDGSWSLVPGASLSPAAVLSLTIPATATVTAAAVIAALAPYASSEDAFTDTEFAAALGITQGGADDVLTCLSANPSPLSKSSAVLVQQSAADATWSVVPGAPVGAGSGVTIPIPPTATVSPAAMLSKLQTYLASQATFTDADFASALGTTTQGADDLLTGLAGAVPSALVQQVAAGTWSVLPGADLTASVVAIPPTATVTQAATPTAPATTSLVSAAELLAVLAPYLPSAVLVTSLGAALGFTTDKVVALAACAGQPLGTAAVDAVVTGAAPLTRPLPNPPPADPPPPDALTTLLTNLLPLAVVFGSSVWNTPLPVTGPPLPPALAPIDFVRSYPSVFAPAPSPQPPQARNVTLEELRALSVYAAFAQRQLAESPPGQPADLQKVLTGFSGGRFASAPNATAALARVLGVPVGLVNGLTTPVAAPPVPLPPIAALALGVLDRAAQLASTLGLAGATLHALITNEYDAVSSAADALVLTLRSRYPDATAQATKLDAAEQPIRVAKRDSLTDYLIHTFKAPKSEGSDAPGTQVWSTLDDLYEYFLIDVDAGGCLTTSWVVEATMGAQLYVYRAIMNLEQNGLPPSDPKHFALRLPDDAAQEWEWRKNHRVWQANREVFLWPENYLDPDLRDDMTPLFQDLQTQLLQNNVDSGSIADVYSQYLAGFEEVSSLTIAGAYHDTSHPSDVLHLFGVTSSDPPTYYYRTCQDFKTSARDGLSSAVWSPWQKVTVQIAARTVSPVVYEGRLLVFWVDIKTKPVNTVSNGGSNFTGYLHTMKLYFTMLRQNGTWTTQQQVQLPPNVSSPSGNTVFGPGAGQIEDPLTTLSGGAQVASLDPQQRDTRDSQGNPQSIDDYTLSGPNWLSLSLQPVSGNLLIQYRNFIEFGTVDVFGRQLLAADPTVGFPPGGGSPVASAWTLPIESRFPYSSLLATGDTVESNPGAFLQLQDGSVSGKPLRVHSRSRALAWRWLPSAFANAIIDPSHEQALSVEALVPSGTLSANTKARNMAAELADSSLLTAELSTAVEIATVPFGTELLALPGSGEDALLQVGNDILLVRGSTDDDGGYDLLRFGTTLAAEVARVLFENGLDTVLSLETQEGLEEAATPIQITDTSRLGDRTNKLPWDGSYSTYYWEIFFHIPFLVANALHAQGDFASAQSWYHYIFDPTSTEIIDLKGVPPADQPQRALDRVWRFLELRGLDPPTVRDILTDPTTIALYQSDPFNPWAIARNRSSAFQKAIVMKYVQNLLDWGDMLFTQFTMESVHEAEMLYVMALDTLGPGSTDVGDCGAGDTAITYAEVADQLDDEHEFLVEFETQSIGARSTSRERGSHRRARHGAPKASAKAPRYTHPPSRVAHAVQRSPLLPRPRPIGRRKDGADADDASNADHGHRSDGKSPQKAVFRGLGWKKMVTSSWGPSLGSAKKKTKDAAGGRTFQLARSINFASKHAGHGRSIMRQATAFAVPANGNLLGYWARVEDRLYKIRNCMDINGNLRQLALFAPPINPMDLVAMRAAGLSLEDVLGRGNGDLPPYRFVYLIEKAKSYAATLSGFGSALLSALEKKDGEELNQLRLTQQLNMAQAMMQSRQMEIDAANAAYNAVSQQLQSASYRANYYSDLLSAGNNAWEVTQVVAGVIAAEYHGQAPLNHLLGVGLALIPQIGSPFAFKIGGVEFHGSVGHFAAFCDKLGALADGVANMAGLQAGFARRDEGWQNQSQLANFDVQALTYQQTAAQIRINIANNALALQQKAIDQTQEFLDRTQDKLTNLGLYTWLASTLQAFYHDAYTNALALANLAQEAYLFERGDHTVPGLTPPYWSSTRAGLLAGEHLLRDLETLERRYIETNYRTFEIDQPFALSQVDAAALLDLRQTGQCTFTISEVFFDLFYAGQYKRRIKAVRLTIPCITGPYVNVGATLELRSSWIRTGTKLSDPLRTVPPTRTVTIATSTAQNDAGVFELSFRDERYLPFEGLGAISRWQLTLPGTFPQLDYQTINDVILSISYTAEQHSGLRAEVEQQNAAIQGTILNFFANAHPEVDPIYPPPNRLFSMRQEFSSAFTRLLRSPVNSAPVSFELSERNFPFFLRGRTLTPGRLVLLLHADATAAQGFTLTFDGASLSPKADTSSSPQFYGLPYAKVALGTSLLGAHALVITAAGGLAPTSPAPGDVSAVDPIQLTDILLYLEYTTS